MIEKYGVDFSELPATKDQCEKIKELTEKLGMEYVRPINRKAADEAYLSLLEKVSLEE